MHIIPRVSELPFGDGRSPPGQLLDARGRNQGAINDDDTQVGLLQMIHECCMVFVGALFHDRGSCVVAKNGPQRTPPKAHGVCSLVGINEFGFNFDEAPTITKEVNP